MSILRLVRGAFTPARASRADEADRFDIGSSPDRIGHHEHAPVSGSTQTQVARLRLGVREVGAIQCVCVGEHRHGVVEGDAVLTAAFRASHSNTIQYIRNAACSPATDQEAVPHAPRPIPET